MCGLLLCSPDRCPAANFQEWKYLDNELAPYQGSSWIDIDSMLSFVDIKPTDRLLDVGAGDGRVLLRASSRGILYAEGWELSEDVYLLGRQHISRILNTHEQRNCRIYHGDFSRSRPWDFSVITMFLLPHGLDVVSTWLKSHMANNSSRQAVTVTVVSLSWAIPNLAVKKSTVFPGGTKCFVYEIDLEIK